MKCPRCGTAVNEIAKYCGLCRRPLDAPPGWELREHDAITCACKGGDPRDLAECCLR